MFRKLVFLSTPVLILIPTLVAAQVSYEFADGVNPQPISTEIQTASEFSGQQFHATDPTISATSASCNCAAATPQSQCRSNRCLGRSQGTQIGSTIKHLVSREVPSGNQGLNMPYYTPQLYYYKRPYNTMHIRAENQRLEPHPDGNYSNPKHLYSTEVFDEIHKQLNPIHNRSTELGYLEYSDWKQFEAARDEWEFHRPGNINASSPTDTIAPPVPVTPRAVLGSTSARRPN